MFSRTGPREVIVFFIGGTTFEEAKAVADWNHKNGAAMRVVLGGSGVLNSRQFMDALTAGGKGAAGHFHDIL